METISATVPDLIIELRRVEKDREFLWGLLDDIDTASDMAKNNDSYYRRIVETLQRKRNEVGESLDGQTITWKNTGSLSSQRFGFSLLDAAFVAVEILRGMGCSNDTVFHASSSQLQAMCESIIFMHGAGCAFTDEQILMLFEGEEDEATSMFEKFNEGNGWSTLNRLLNEIFEQPDDAGAGEEEGLCRAQLY